MRKLPIFKGYTVDERLGEFRKLEYGKEIEYIPFSSEKGKLLLAEYQDRKRGAGLLTKELREKLPVLYSQENNENPLVICKFFLPNSYWTWYATEFDSKDTFFGYVIGDFPEMGYFSLSELEQLRAPLTICIGRKCQTYQRIVMVERDLNFEPCPLSEVINYYKEKGYAK